MDIMATLNSFHSLRCEDLNLLNSASVVLIPKKDGAETVHDFRPISLIHTFAKIISKILAIRLAPRMDELIVPCQSAFIKGRSIHDNFLYVRNIARRFHQNKMPALLMKLDISKAFDSVRWDFLLDLLQKRGFPTRCRHWIAATLASSTSRILLNGIPSEPILHGRGLRQGDPLSPLLFILAMDPLHRLFSKATDLGLLSKVRGRLLRFRVSMYADDAAVFIKPTKKDIDNLAQILIEFGNTTGLHTNINKTTVTPISCASIDLDHLLQALPMARANFPMKYLGLPLTVCRLRKIEFRPLLDKAMAKISS